VSYDLFRSLNPLLPCGRRQVAVDAVLYDRHMLKSTPPLREETISSGALNRSFLSLKSTPPLREETAEFPRKVVDDQLKSTPPLREETAVVPAHCLVLGA